MELFWHVGSSESFIIESQRGCRILKVLCVSNPKGKVYSDWIGFGVFFGIIWSCKNHLCKINNSWLNITHFENDIEF